MNPGVFNGGLRTPGVFSSPGGRDVGRGSVSVLKSGVGSLMESTSRTEPRQHLPEPHPPQPLSETEEPTGSSLGSLSPSPSEPSETPRRGSPRAALQFQISLLPCTRTPDTGLLPGPLSHHEEPIPLVREVSARRNVFPFINLSLNDLSPYRLNVYDKVY